MQGLRFRTLCDLGLELMRAAIEHIGSTALCKRFVECSY